MLGARRLSLLLTFGSCVFHLVAILFTQIIFRPFLYLEREADWEEEEEEERRPHPQLVTRAKEGEGKQGKRRKRWPLVLRWSPFTLVALFSYTEYRKLRDPDRPIRHWEISCYRLLPWKTVSKTWGFINNVELPIWARGPFLSWYSSTFGCVIAEAEIEDLSLYRNLGEFFRRALKPGVRPICGMSPMVSPADGTLLAAGEMTNGMVEQVKGVSYSLQAFLGPESWANGPRKTSSYVVPREEYASNLLKDPENNSLYTTVIYLAPGDYHRFHSPVDWKVKFRRHFAGELLSVNPRMARVICGLFTLNERAVYVGEWSEGFFCMAAVGATNVGSIRVYQDPELSTNSWRLRKNSWRDKPLSLSFAKGEEFGEFNLGSTIVLLFEAPKGAEVNMPMSMSDKVLVGRPLLQQQSAKKSFNSH